MIKVMRQENSEILEQLKESKKESKDLKKAVIERDKHLHNLNKDIENESDKCKQLKAKVEELTATANRERKQQERKQKKREQNDFLNNLKVEPFEKVFECEVCEMKFETKTQLKFHVSSEHKRDIYSQTEHSEIKDVFVQTNVSDLTIDKNVQTEDAKTTFVKYPCNYCGTNIANNYHLFEHITKCRGTHNMGTAPGLPLPPFFPSRFQLPPLLRSQFRL